MPLKFAPELEKVKDGREREMVGIRRDWRVQNVSRAALSMLSVRKGKNFLDA